MTIFNLSLALIEHFKMVEVLSVTEHFNAIYIVAIAENAPVTIVATSSLSEEVNVSIRLLVRRKIVKALANLIIDLIWPAFPVIVLSLFFILLFCNLVLLEKTF